VQRAIGVVPRFELFVPGEPDRPGVNPFTRQPIVIRGRRERREVLEIELRGASVETCAFKHGGRPRIASRRFTTAEQASRAFATELARAVRRGFREVGPSQRLAPAPPHASGSALLLDELFAAGDPRVLDEVLACSAEQKLAALAEPWIADARPEMRRALLSYVDDGCDRAQHKALVKRLYKLAEERGDDELVAHFLVAFDRLSHRYVAERVVLRSRRLVRRKILAADPMVPERLKAGQASSRFTRATRRYLARRAFRYFRAIGRSDPARYGRGIRIALALYEDAHLDAPERLLDSWGLLHALYAWSPVLERHPRGIRVVEGAQLAALDPAPYFPLAWRGVRDALFELVVAARSRTVRTWTVAWLKKEYLAGADAIPVAALRPLLASRHDEAARLGSELLERATGLDVLPVGDWLALLSIENLEALPLVCTAFERHVLPGRLTLSQCVELASSRAASVAELGLRWAQDKAQSDGDLGPFARLAEAPVHRVRVEGTTWLLDRLCRASSPRAALLRDLLDARFADVRALAIAHADASHQELGFPLWLSLLESPYDEVRALVVKHAVVWQAEAGVDEMRHLAATVILAVHRGSAAKQTILRRIADRLVTRPEEAERLLPVLSLAVRSVRPAERVGALLAVARASLADATLREAVARHFPDLVVDPRVSA
jgi:hypothetical protein